MDDKSASFALAAKDSKRSGIAAHYRAFFDCFNRQQFFEAHEVLEVAWLPQRHASDGNFLKGLIQLAGAFVHVQKGRPAPAISLLKLAQANLARYPGFHEGLDLAPIKAMVDDWVRRLGADEVTGEFPLLEYSGR
jgi:predicted metal-dependent hydrolase